MIGCSALTESDAGSDPLGSMVSTARLENGQYVINGNKHWIENAPMADMCLIYAKTEDNVLRGFLIEKGTPGLETY